jgi:serine/threonine-protein kinase
MTDSSGKATASLILGIASIVLFWVPFLYLVTAVPAGIIAVNFGSKGRRNKAAAGSGAATAGMVCGIIGLVLCAINGVLGALLTFA